MEKISTGKHGGRVLNKLSHYAGILLIALTTMVFASCSDKSDPVDEPQAPSHPLVGTWTAQETVTQDGMSLTLKMTLTFQEDNMGTIVEEWIASTRATTHETYAMTFSWSTTSDASGNDILRVSYVSGDKNTELFSGSANTALWTRQYVLTGRILNIYEGGGVWVFNKN